MWIKQQSFYYLGNKITFNRRKAQRKNGRETEEFNGS
jgi:hypothetical protein